MNVDQERKLDLYEQMLALDTDAQMIIKSLAMLESELPLANEITEMREELEHMFKELKKALSDYITI